MSRRWRVMPLTRRNDLPPGRDRASLRTDDGALRPPEGGLSDPGADFAVPGTQTFEPHQCTPPESTLCLLSGSRASSLFSGYVQTSHVSLLGPLRVMVMEDSISQKSCAKRYSHFDPSTWSLMLYFGTN